jgi:hypothetical protein
MSLVVSTDRWQSSLLTISTGTPPRRATVPAFLF